MKIYADVLFFINFITSYLMLLLTGGIIRRKSSAKRLISASALGALGAVLSFLTPRFGIFIRLIGAVVMILTAFGYRKGDTFVHILLFMLISAVMSAMFAFISSVFGEETVTVKNGIAYFSLPAVRFIAIFIAAYTLTALVSKLVKQRQSARLLTLQVKLDGKTAEFTALLDSGNALKEPISGKSVVIAEWKKIKSLFNGISYEELINNAAEFRLRIVPYHSLGNKNGMIFAFLADDIIIPDEKRSTGKIFVGITNEDLSGTNEYNALIGASV